MATALQLQPIQEQECLLQIINAQQWQSWLAAVWQELKFFF